MGNMANAEQVEGLDREFVALEYDFLSCNQPGEFIRRIFNSNDFAVGAVLEKLAGYGERLAKGTTFWRARPGRRDSTSGFVSTWNGREMRGNPEYPAARANFKGQPVLYCADSRETAVAETREESGTLVSVCPAVLRSNTTIIDLCTKHSGANDPTLLDSFFSHLSCKMAEPVEYLRNYEDYLVTQFISQLARNQGFAGIRFSSTLNVRGHNVALFDPDSIELGASELVSAGPLSRLRDLQSRIVTNFGLILE
jgi:hypothetical protein